MSAPPDPDAVFADLRIACLERQAAAGEAVDLSEIDRLHEVYQSRDPACWSWPAPAMCTFADESTAGKFLRWWNQTCAVCGASGMGGLVEDHDHKTSFTRGYLCQSCNAQEGKSDAPVYQKYRERNPASILGIKVRYWSPWTGYAEPEPEHTVNDETQRQAAVNRLHLPPPDELH